VAGPAVGRQEPDQGLAAVSGHQTEAEHATPSQRRQGGWRNQ